MSRAIPRWSSPISTSRCRYCAWQRKGRHMWYFIYNLILTKNLGCDWLRPTNASLFHVLECSLNNARSRSMSTQTKVKVKRLFHVVLAPRWCSVPTSPPRWSSSHSMCTASSTFFLALLTELHPHPSMILQQLPELDHLWDWSYPGSGLDSWTEIPHLCQTLSQSFSVPG